MIIKVCGLKDAANLAEVLRRPAISWVGLNFYPRSPRCVDQEPEVLLAPFRTNGEFDASSAERVGIFVNEDVSTISAIAERYRLHRLQLHGTETPEYCAALNHRWPVIKAFAVDGDFDFGDTDKYAGSCTHFLFDSAGAQRGGNGFAFDWRLLDAYPGETPFLLAGGIAPEDARSILHLKHPRFTGVDLNSRFEREPGLKDVAKLDRFLDELL